MLYHLIERMNGYALSYDSELLNVNELQANELQRQLWIISEFQDKTVPQVQVSSHTTVNTTKSVELTDFSR